MERKEAIQGAYRMTGGNNFYDGMQPMFITGHTGWTDNFESAFAHKDQLCLPFKKRVHDPSALYDAYDEPDDTEENANGGFLKGVGQ